MTPEEFEQHGHAVVDWIANYMREVERYPVLSQAKPGDIKRALPVHAPQRGESFDDILDDVNRIIMPGITHWQSPNFFAYFPANASGPAILGDLLSAGLGVQGMLWSTSPACTELETRVLDWLVDMLGLPTRFLSTEAGGGVIQDSASSAGLCAMIAARERTTRFESNETGTAGNLTAYMSREAHSSLEKAAKISGIGRANVRLIDTDKNNAMRADALQNAITTDIARGLTPFFAAATIGTTSTTAIDPILDIGEICQAHNIWFHVDGAHAGSAALCPEFRWLHDGMELADSYCFNPHKWMLTNFDCDCFFVADRAILIESLSILPEYLKNQATESGAVIDYRDWQVPLGRRFRSLKLWFVIRSYGVEGLRDHIRSHVRMAQQLVQRIEQHDDFELVTPASLNLVCFRHKSGDDANAALMNTLNDSGDMYLTHTSVDGKLTLRMAIGGTWTREHHVDRAWNLIQSASTNL